MTMYRARSAVLAMIISSACSHPQHTAAPAAPPPPPVAVKPPMLVVLPAESDAFPKAAQATTESLIHTQLAGLVPYISKVSLEVVQLSIECVDPTTECYEAVGRSLTANRLLFAQIAAVKRRQVKVTVTLFAVGTKQPRTKAEKVFASEDEAAAGIADLVAEATRP